MPQLWVNEPILGLNMLSTFGVVNTSNSGMIVFEPTEYKPHMPHHISFHIVVVYATKLLTWNIFCTVMDEGASTCVISLACWKAIGKRELSLSSTLLIIFYGQYFIPHEIIPSFPMQLEGKTMCFEVEVVDAPLDDNILLGWSWNYTVIVVLSTDFWVLCFPHEGQIVIVDHLSFSHLDPSSRASTVPMIDNP
jgi:hypothetical protein